MKQLSLKSLNCPGGAQICSSPTSTSKCWDYGCAPPRPAVTISLFEGNIRMRENCGISFCPHTEANRQHFQSKFIELIVMAANTLLQFPQPRLGLPESVQPLRTISGAVRAHSQPNISVPGWPPLTSGPECPESRIATSLRILWSACLSTQGKQLCWVVSLDLHQDPTKQILPPFFRARN